MAMLPGCPFAPRCAVKLAVCETLQPALVAPKDDGLGQIEGHRVACHLVGGAA